jgi:PTS system ascorbate-specific IIA component
MTGLFIIAHAPLASALRAAAMHAYPEAAQAIAVYDVPPGDDFERYEAEACAAIDALGADEVLILTDVVGATPANLAVQLVRRGHRKALAGVNVPMVWRALNYGNLPLDERLVRARDGALTAVQPVVTPPPQNQAQAPAAHDPQHRHHQQ